MKSFKTHIKEGKANLHMTHVNDSMYIDGYAGFRASLGMMSSVLSRLAGYTKSKINVATKFDGSPAVYLGYNPENGQFFVATKSLFNKTPKINYTEEDIRANHAGGLLEILPLVLKYGKELGIPKGIILQGDLMFTPSVKKKTSIDGEEHWLFQPNTIAYAVPTHTEMGKRIGAAKIGIVFHTVYTGKSLDTLSASFNINLSKLKKTKNVFYADAFFKDLSGNVSFTAQETSELRSKINELFSDGKALKSIMDRISKNADVVASMSQYINSKVRVGNTSSNNTTEYLAYINENFKTSEVKRKLVSEFVYTHKYDIDNLFRLHSKIDDVKNVLVNRLSSIQSMKHFVKSGNGDLVVTKPEGFVASDHVGNAIKLVDRYEFSRLNFGNRG